MLVDRARFLVIAGAIAAAGVAASACEREPDRGRVPTPPPTPPTPSAALSAALQAGPITVDVLNPAVVPGAAVCDDNQGTAEECPSVGPSDEGACANVISKRCNDFKVAMKPRIAAQAVACLRALKPAERCDPSRINQCGHAALVNACPEPARPRQAQILAATATQAVSVMIAPAATPDPSPTAAACDAISKACGQRPLAPTLADCQQTLAGMTELGRANMVACVSLHCVDGGLYACEAMPKPAAVKL